MLVGDELFHFHSAPDLLATIGPAQFQLFDRDRRQRRVLADGPLFEFEQTDLFAHIKKAFSDHKTLSEHSALFMFERGFFTAPRRRGSGLAGQTA